MPAHRTFNRDRVATVILDAIDLGLPVVATVQEVMEATESQARHMIRMARKDGLVGMAEHKPARAMIHRGAPTEKSWMVCAHCLTTWPCPDGFPSQRRKH